MATMITTAKLNDVDPQARLADVLARVADTPVIKLEQLLPWHWQPEKSLRDQAA
jgi:transposase